MSSQAGTLITKRAFQLQVWQIPCGAKLDLTLTQGLQSQSIRLSSFVNNLKLPRELPFYIGNYLKKRKRPCSLGSRSWAVSVTLEFFLYHLIIAPTLLF